MVASIPAASGFIASNSNTTFIFSKALFPVGSVKRCASMSALAPSNNAAISSASSTAIDFMAGRKTRAMIRTQVLIMNLL